MNARDTITHRAADIADTIDHIQLGRWAEGKEALATAIVALVEEATAGAPRPVLPRGAGESEDEWTGRGYGLFNLEGEGDPIVVFFGHDGEAAAARELVRRQALPNDDEDRLDMYHGLLRCETAMLVWNSVEADPRVALDGEGEG